VFENSFTGTLPKELASLDLLELRANQNLLIGTIPAEITQNSTMQFLRLDSNQFSGTIPSTIGNMAGLVDLRLNNNTLTGPIPFTFYGLNQLRKSHSFASVVSENDMFCFSSQLYNHSCCGPQF
jgi:hypothetical protein